jgi:hypothetical protein
MSKPLLFRFHKGMLEESMQTMREIYSFESLIMMINCEWDFMPVAIRVSPYVYDDRINWDTHIVTAKFKGLEDSGFMPVGFLNRDPGWSHQQGEVNEVEA